MIAGYIRLATGIFGGVADAHDKTFLFLKSSLPMADLRLPFRSYLSAAFLSCLLAYLTALTVTAVLVSLWHVSLMPTIGYLTFLPIIVMMAAFGLFLYYPYQQVSSRRKNIEASLPFVITHMSAIAQSGVPPYVVFKLIGSFKEYGEIAKEMQKIVRNIEKYGSDPLSAIRDVAERTPSDSLRQLLFGFITTTESGGNIKFYLKNTSEQTLFEWKIRRERFLQQLSTYAEFYTGLLIAAPLFIISLFSVMFLISPNLVGYDIRFLTRLSIYLVIPLLNVLFLVFLKGVEVEI